LFYRSNKIKRTLQETLVDYKCRKLAKGYLFGGGYKRIYLYHIRKTGGTSLNHILLSIDTENVTGAEIYSQLPHANAFRVIHNKKVFVGWNKKLIGAGNYFYAFSHIPAHELKLPLDTFTVTCLRNPVDRVLSLYKMLLFYRDNRIPHPCMAREGKWLGGSFKDFLSNIPPQHLSNQLYMFSRTFDVNEAFDHIIRCSHFIFTENFTQGVDELAVKLAKSIKAVHVRKSPLKLDIDPACLEKLRSRLEPEFSLYARLQEYQQSL
jgi:hypothetical protein